MRPAWWRTVQILLLAALLTLPFWPGRSELRAAGWTPSDHPRLLATVAEKPALVARLTTPGTVSAAEWSAFLTSYRYGSTSYIDYSDGAVISWITGDATAGRRAIDKAKLLMTAYPDGLVPSGGSFNEEWYKFRDFLLTYDFAYPLLTDQEKTDFKNFMVLQGGRCAAAGPGYAPGNINTLWGLCLYGSAILLDGENMSIPVVDEPVVRGSLNGGDALRYAIDATNIKISNAAGQPTADYVEGTDYSYAWVPNVCSRCVNWSRSGAEPAVGATYYVSYTVVPNIAKWKTTARQFFEYHLNYQWHDGAYNGGLNPYGNLVADMLPYFMEMFKRDAGIDYSRNEDVKRLVDMYLYERLPGSTRRFDTLNDSAGWGGIDQDALYYPKDYFRRYRSWLRPFVAWATTAYAGDPEGYDQRYAWLWTQAYRNSNGTLLYTPDADWREAFWINNSAFGTYPSTSAPTPDWPKERYFRGKEIVYFRTGPWTGNDAQSNVISVQAGPHNYLNEHDQADSGSFTWYGLGEDWVIDPGYGFDSFGDHNVATVDNTTALPGTFGGNTSFDHVVLTDDAAAMKANLRGAWSTTSTPGVDHDDRYLAVIGGAQPTYLVVADDLAKDATARSYQWLLHAGYGNTVTTSGTTATVTGARTGATMAVSRLNPTGGTVATSIASGYQGSHRLITSSVSGVVDPYFLHLIIPVGPSQRQPTISRAAVTNGVSGTVDWGSGTSDTILWRTGSGSVSGGGVTSDARLTVVRTSNGTVTGLLVIDGRAVTTGSQTLLTVADGSRPVSIAAFGPKVGIRGTDASQIRLGLPFLTSAALEDGGLTIPLTMVGGTAYINTGLPLGDMRPGQGQRYDERFDDGYVDNFFYSYIKNPPVTDLTAAGGALELIDTTVEWPGLSRRNSTPFRLAGIYSTVIPPVDHGNTDIAFRFRFTAQSGNNRRLRAYFRVRDRNPTDWNVNQDYVRLELSAAEGGAVKNTATIGQRVNGSWSTITDNDTLTSQLPSAAAALNDTSWHQVTVRLNGDAATVTIDGQPVLSGTLPTPIPTAPSSGYLQWRVTGPNVQLDDLTVSAIDATPPVGPTSGAVGLAGSTATVQLVYGQGSSTDAATATLYVSDNPISPTADVSQLTAVTAVAASNTRFTFGGGDRTKSYAIRITDIRGNASPLVPLAVDTVPPAAITDLSAG